MNPQVNKEHYFKKKYADLGRFVSYFYQVDLTTGLRPRKILEIGKGNGTLSDYLKRLGLAVVTADFDKNLNPDVVADVRQLPLADNEFDVVTAFEVLEHIPFADVPKALTEIKRVTSRYAVLSLPYRSTGLELTIRFPGVRTLFRKPLLDFFLRLPLKFSGLAASGQHHWEIDRWHYRLGKVRKLLEREFRIVQELRPPLNYYHYFFVLEKK